MKYPRLKARRVELGLTQIELADRLGIEPCTYNAKELGKRSFTINEILKLLTILNCKFEDIFL